MKQPEHGEDFKFTFGIDLYDLIGIEGMEHMNEYMDQALARDYPKRNIILTDVTYKVASSFKEPASDTVFIEATGIIEDLDAEDEDEYEED